MGKICMIPTANQIYKHFKGNLYRIITIAKHSETEEDMVVYQALYGEYTVYTRPLTDFTKVLDADKYPTAKQKYRFELVREIVEPVSGQRDSKSAMGKEVLKPMAEEKASETITEKEEFQVVKTMDAVVSSEENRQMKDTAKERANEENVTIDPMLEAYLDTDSYRERLNILHGLQHRITEHMLLTMAVVIDFELPEGSIEKKYDALHDCLLTRERYECNRMI